MANIKFSSFTTETNPANVDFLVGYEGTTMKKIDPTNIDSYYDRAQSKYALGDYQGSIEDCNIAIEIDPDNKWSYIISADPKKMLGDITGTVNDINKALEIDPLYPLGYETLAALKEELGDDKSSSENLQKAIDSYKQRGLNRQKEGNTKGARQDWERAVELGDEEADKLIEEYL